MTPKYDRANLVDLLTERLEFERAAMGLYDALLGKLARLDDPKLTRLIPRLSQYRDEEVEHAAWLGGLVERLGGGPKRTPLTQAVARETRALEDVVEHVNGSMLPAFHAMLSSELMDYEGWDLLLQIARDNGDEEVIPDLEMRLRHERAHLDLIRQATVSLMADSVAFHGNVQQTRPSVGGFEREKSQPRHQRRPMNVDVTGSAPSGATRRPGRARSHARPT